jgi:hypothetical protein
MVEVLDSLAERTIFDQSVTSAASNVRDAKALLTCQDALPLYMRWFAGKSAAPILVFTFPEPDIIGTLSPVPPSKA